jgi:hypothetical protein
MVPETRPTRQSTLISSALLSAVCMVCCGWAHRLAAEPPPPLESEVKAAFLLNFAKFVDWQPAFFAASGSPLAICIVGTDPFGPAIDELIQGEAVSGRKLVVRRIGEPPQPRTCQIVYTEGGKEASRLLSALGPGVLTVGEGEGFLRNGGIIGFVIENRRVRFDINQKAAETAALKLSSRLLSVARVVEK